VSIEASISVEEEATRSSISRERSGRKIGTAYVQYQALQETRSLLVCQHNTRTYQQERIETEDDKSKLLGSSRGQ